MKVNPTPWEQSPPSEASSRLASQEIPYQFWNQNIHCRVRKSPPLLPVLRHTNPVHTFPPYFCKIRSIILSPTLKSTK